MNKRYRIEHEDGRVLLADASLDDVDGWWKCHEKEYFGIRLDGDTVIVADAASDSCDAP